MNSAFKLLIYAIVAAALLWLFYTYMAPLFFPMGDAAKDIEAGLKSAEVNPGRFVAADVWFARSTVLNAPAFDTQTRSVTFSCNKAGVCCDLTEECEKDPLGCAEAKQGCRIAYKPRRAIALVRDKVHASYRCGFESGIFNCRAYFGDEPAQLEISAIDFKESFDLKGEDAMVKFKVKNSGKMPAFDIVATANVYKITKENGRDVENIYNGPFTEEIEKLGADAEQEIGFALGVKDTGDYVLKLRTEAPDSGADENQVRFTAKAAYITLGCEATSKGEILQRNGECAQKYSCKGCQFAYECVIQWKNAGETGLELSDPGFAYGASSGFEELCEVPADCSAEATGETRFSGSDCLTELACKNCQSAEECKQAWVEMGSDPALTISESGSMAYLKRNIKYCKDATPPAPLGAESAGFCSLAKEITEANNPARLAKCTKHLALLKKYLESSGLKERGFDILLLESIILAESGCNADPSRANCQGLMQVASCGSGQRGNCTSNCTIEENIKRGTAHLARDYDKAAQNGIKGMDAIRLILFAYNRGIGSMGKAIEIYNANPEGGLKQAMAESCYFYYDKGSYGNCSGFTKEECCTRHGLGTGYPDKIIGFYKDACAQAQGTIDEKAKPVSKGKTVVIDPGHGAIAKATGGCSSVRTYKLNGLTESDYALDFSTKVKAILEAKGFNVILTRSSSDENPGCRARANVANSANASAFVSLHLNAGGSSANGTFTLVCKDSKCGSGRVRESMELAKEIHERIVALGLNGRRGIQPDTASAPGSLGVLRSTKMPAVLTEVAFITGSTDKALLTDEGKRQQIAEAIASGIEAYLGLPASAEPDVKTDVQEEILEGGEAVEGVESAAGKACSNPATIPEGKDGVRDEVVVVKGAPNCGKPGGNSDPECQKLYYCVDGAVRNMDFKNSQNNEWAVISTGAVSGEKERLGDKKTPTGTFLVRGKIRPHPKFPNGFIHLDMKERFGYDPEIGLHDLKNSANIGRQRSQGCIRMYGEDLRKIWDVLQVGDPVTIRDGIG